MPTRNPKYVAYGQKVSRSLAAHFAPPKQMHCGKGAGMSNRFPGVCYRCGKDVPPRSGVFEKVTAAQREKWPGKMAGVKWLIQHHSCAAKYKGTAVHFRFAPDETKAG